MLILLGLILWGLIARDVASAAAAIFVWGLGFAAGNSMQQARLISAEPQLASASVALNSSVLYGGQAIGASIGGALLAGGQAGALSWTGAAIVALALLLSIFVTRVMKV
jgi:predicted MFS family arabinose efflux permease